MRQTVLTLGFLATMYILTLSQSAAASQAKKKSEKKEQASSDMQIYHITNPYRVELYTSENNGWASDKKTLDLSKGDLVYAQQVKDVNGNTVLRIPYFDEASKNKTKKFYILNKKARSTNGEFTVPYKPILPGEKPKTADFIDSQDQIVYVDRPGGSVATLTDTPGVTWRDCVKQKGKCTGWPSSNDPLEVQFTKITQVTDPLTGRKSDELFYYVKTKYKRKSCSSASENTDDAAPTEDMENCREHTYNRQGWIPARDIINFRRDDSLKDDLITSYFTERKRTAKNGQKKPDCPPNTKKDEIANVGNNIHTFNTRLSDFLGKCVKKPLTNQYQTPFDNHLRAHWETVGASPVAGYSTDQLFAIDSLARALYGEMRSCSHTSGYLKIISRVMMNRSLVIQKEKGQVDAFLSELGKQKLKELKNHKGSLSLEEILPYVISSPQQISSFNSDDVNLKVNLCPKGTFNADPENKLIWQRCVAVAEEAVTHLSDLIKETPDIDALFYSSNMKPDWAENMERMDEFNIKNGDKNLKLHNPRCVILWKAQKQKNEDGHNKHLRNLQKILKAK